MSDIDPVIFEFQARVNGYLADVARTTRTVDHQLGLQEKRLQSLEQQFRRSSGAISGQLRGLAGTIGAAFTLRGTQTLIDDFTRLQNQLRVAGLEGKDLADVQARLLEIGSKYGVSVNALSELFGKAASAGKDLGASQEQVLKLAEASSQALLITGTSTEAASGAILGLSQALASGTVHAEEFNQMNEGGLRPLLAAAAASERWGGSIGKLRQDITAGKVSSAELFQTILTGSQQLGDQAAKATLTLAGAFTSLNNRLIEYVGGAASGQGATGALSAGIQALGENLDTIIPALALVATALGVRYVAAAGAAIASSEAVGAAVFAMQARMVGAATTAEALQFALAGLGLNPVTVAVLALGAGMYYLATRANTAADAIDRHSDALQSAAGMKSKAIDLARKLASATDQERAATEASIGATLKKAEADRIAAVAAMRRAQAELASAKATEAGFAASAARDGSSRGLAEMGTARGEATRSVRVKTGDFQAAAQIVKDLDETIRVLKNPASVSIPRIPMPTGGSGKSSGKKTRSSGAGTTSGPKPEEIAQRQAEEMSRLRQEELRAQLDLTTDAGKRATLAQALLDEEYAQRVAQIESQKDFTGKQKAALIAELRKLYGTPAKYDQKTGELIAEGRPGLLYQQVNQDLEKRRDAQAEALLDMQADALQVEAGAAETRAERLAIERRILDIQEQIERKKLDEAIAAGDITDAETARAALARKQGARRASAEIEGMSTLERYSYDLEHTDINEKVESYVVEEINSVRDGIHNALTKAIGIKDPLISSLLNLLIDQVIMKPLAQALSQSGGIGGGGNSLLAAGGALLGSLFGRASGGSVLGGQVYRVNEGASPGRVEGFIPRGSGEIIPLGRMHALAQQRPHVVQPVIHVDARGAVMNDQFATMILAQAKSYAAEAGAKSYSQSMRDAPAAVSRKQRYG